MNRIRFRNWRGMRAQSIMEFALIIPILMLIVLGIIAFGQLFSYKIRLDNAAREGARVGAVGRTKAQIDTIVRNRANVPGSGNANCSPGNECLVVAVMPDDGSAQPGPNCTGTNSNRTIGQDLVVTVRYDAYITVPVIGFFMSPKTLYSRSVMRIEGCQ